EFLIKLPQWASFRDRALHGIADSYLRKTDYEKSLEWLGALEKSFPAYYKKQKLGEYQSLVEARLARTKSGPDGLPVTGFVTGFEPGEQELPVKAVNFRTVPGLGIAGPHVSTFEQITAIRTHTASYEYSLKNITPGGMYWVEFWYRDAVPGSTL